MLIFVITKQINYKIMKTQIKSRGKLKVLLVFPKLSKKQYKHLEGKVNVNGVTIEDNEGEVDVSVETVVYNEKGVECILEDVSPNLESKMLSEPLSMYVTFTDDLNIEGNIEVKASLIGDTYYFEDKQISVEQ